MQRSQNLALGPDLTLRGPSLQCPITVIPQ